MDNSSDIWSVIGGIGIIVLWVRLVISVLRTERYTKTAAEALTKMALHSEAQRTQAELENAVRSGLLMGRESRV